MFYTGKRVLVTGGTGFVGVHIVQELLKQGARVVVPLHHRALPPFEGAQNIELVSADLFSIDDCLKVIRDIDFVFQAAGGVGAAGGGPVAQMELIRKNLLLTAQVLVNADGSLETFETVQGVTLATAREFHNSVVVGDYVYIVGGGTGNTPTNSVERAAIKADGSIGSFEPLSGVQLVEPRTYSSSVLVGDHFYVLGGQAAVGGAMDSVERATIAADGTFGPFETISGATLANARFLHASVVVAESIYVLGGLGAGVLNSVERVTVAGDGSLGTFTTVQGVALVTGRMTLTSHATRNQLYAFGGIMGPSAFVKTIERATINADGSLGNFATDAITFVTSTRLRPSVVVIGDYGARRGARAPQWLPRTSARGSAGASPRLSPSSRAQNSRSGRNCPMPGR